MGTVSFDGDRQQLGQFVKALMESKNNAPRQDYDAAIPQSVRQSLGAYQQNPDSLSARNAVFQTLYKVSPMVASGIAGQGVDGYAGLLWAIRNAYGANQGQEQQPTASASGAAATLLHFMNLDGNNSTLSVLYR